MSMEIKKAMLFSILSAGAFAFANPAQAACTSETADQWECLQEESSGTYTDITSNGSGGPYNFSGTSVLNLGSLISATCTLSVTGNVALDTANNEVDITVTGGTITGTSSTCDKLSLAGFPWSSTTISGASGGDVHLADADYAVGDILDVQVTHDDFGTICNGDLPGVKFRNNAAGLGDVTEPSLFIFAGSIASPIPFVSCSVNGDLYSEAGGDVNAW